jgi:hypothetical protein
MPDDVRQSAGDCQGYAEAGETWRGCEVTTAANEVTVLLCQFCGQDAGDCRCEVPGQYSISVPAAVKRFYESAQRGGQFGLYHLLEFVRALVGRQVSDSALTASMRRERSKGNINYIVIDEKRGQYEFMEVAK